MDVPETPSLAEVISADWRKVATPQIDLSFEDDISEKSTGNTPVLTPRKPSTEETQGLDCSIQVEFSPEAPSKEQVAAEPITQPSPAKRTTMVQTEVDLAMTEQVLTDASATVSTQTSFNDDSAARAARADALASLQRANDLADAIERRSVHGSAPLRPPSPKPMTHRPPSPKPWTPAPLRPPSPKPMTHRPPSPKPWTPRPLHPMMSSGPLPPNRHRIGGAHARSNDLHVASVLGAHGARAIVRGAAPVKAPSTTQIRARHYGGLASASYRSASPRFGSADERAMAGARRGENFALASREKRLGQYPSPGVGSYRDILRDQKGHYWATGHKTSAIHYLPAQPRNAWCDAWSGNAWS